MVFMVCLCKVVAIQKKIFFKSFFKSLSCAKTLNAVPVSTGVWSNKVSFQTYCKRVTPVFSGWSIQSYFRANNCVDTHVPCHVSWSSTCLRDFGLSHCCLSNGFTFFMRKMRSSFLSWFCWLIRALITITIMFLSNIKEKPLWCFFFRWIEVRTKSARVILY